MTSNELAERPGLAAVQATQATAVEQARAVAEVQAAVVVAQNCPRDLARAEAEMRDTCSRMAVAERAFYSVPNRGQGASVHLARELARIWGNLTYGVRELRRDDEEGVSEIEVFAWDQQSNVRASRTVQVPHARMKGRNRQKLDDLTDIVNNNNNIGARQLRECIFGLLPDWYIRAAEDACHRTLENGEGVPLPERIGKMVATFAAIGITVEQLEARTGRKRGQWAAGDVAKLGIDYTSITRDGLDPATIFPPDTEAALLAQSTAAETPGQMIPPREEP